MELWMRNWAAGTEHSNDNISQRHTENAELFGIVVRLTRAVSREYDAICEKEEDAQNAHRWAEPAVRTFVYGSLFMVDDGADLVPINENMPADAGLFSVQLKLLNQNSALYVFKNHSNWFTISRNSNPNTTENRMYYHETQRLSLK